MGPKCHIPPLAAARLQTWTILLAAYNYDVEYRSTAKQCNADGLSRLPLPAPESEEISTAALVNLTLIDALPMSRHQLWHSTERDHVLSRIVKYTRSGWPKQWEPELKLFRNRQHELTVEEGCLLMGSK